MKYMGSKRRIAKHIAPILNDAIKKSNITKYIEPFVGGANMIQHIECENKYGLDSNEYLIAMWNALQSGWLPPESISKEEYVAIRDNKEAYSKELVAFTGFVTTYKSKWFGGYAGVGVEKNGKQRFYYDESKRNILKQLSELKNIGFHLKDFRNIDQEKMRGCLVYCDPPYESTTNYRDGFDHDVFWNFVRDISCYNLVYTSEYNAPDDFESIWEGVVTTSLSKSIRKKDIEKLFIIGGQK